MSKIRTQSIRLETGRSVDHQYISIEIWYSDEEFYSPLKEEQQRKYEGFDTEVLKKFNLREHPIKRGKNVIVLSDKTEAALITKIKKFYEKELKDTTTSRDVIIVHFNSPTTHYGGHAYNEEHPQIGLQFGLTYATEFVIGTEKSYSSKAKAGYGHGKFRIWDSDMTILDDTKENRAWLEQLYMALQNVETALTTITENNKTLQEFISSGQKLLPNA